MTKQVSQWQPIETLKDQPREVIKSGVLLAIFLPGDVDDNGVWCPDTIEWGNGPHPRADGSTTWLNFNSSNYWTPRVQFTHWAPLPSTPTVGEKTP